MSRPATNQGLLVESACPRRRSTSGKKISAAWWCRFLADRCAGQSFFHPTLPHREHSFSNANYASGCGLHPSLYAFPPGERRPAKFFWGRDRTGRGPESRVQRCLAIILSCSSICENQRPHQRSGAKQTFRGWVTMARSSHELGKQPPEPSKLVELSCGRYWVRTSDLFRVKEARYHCANRPWHISCHRMKSALGPGEPTLRC